MTNVNMNRAQRRRYAAKMRNSEKVLRNAWNSAPTMIHEDDYEIIDCVLCGATMRNVHDTHAAYPLKPFQTAKEANDDGNIGRCCSDCNFGSVVPARMRNIELGNVDLVSIQDLAGLV
jgi:hypothetical protein